MTPAPTTLNDLFTIVFQAHNDAISQIGEVTVSWRVAAVTGTGATYQQVVDNFDVLWRNNLQANWTADINMRPSRLYVMDAATGLASQIAVATVTMPAFGNSTAGLVPPGAAAVVKKQTTVLGRRGRGRFYHPFLLKSYVDSSGELTAGAVTALNSAYGLVVIGGLVGVSPNQATVQPCIIHRKPLPLTSDDLSIPVACTGLIGTQKRRADYGRRNA